MVQHANPTSTGPPGKKENIPPDTTKASAEEKWSVEKALTEFSVPNPTTPPTSPIQFFHLLNRLKTTKRAGWQRFGIMDGESISDHMYRMSIITMLAPSSLTSQLNIPHCTKMALIHDMAESLVGDITPKDGIPSPEKSRRESTTMTFIASKLLGNSSMNDAGMGIREIWQEYEDNNTKEANFVHDVDKIELILQMVEYEMQYEATIDLSEFMNVAGRVKMPECIKWAEEIVKEREEFWKGVEKVPDSDRKVKEEIKG